MSVYGSDDDQGRKPAANKQEGSMSNTSRIDVFSSEQLPASFGERVIPNAMAVTLQPGDMLFFPAGWWHAMRSETTSFSVSMWF
jgi:ectoine hydroxylase-related dioxygenase (phytanoyl-CoA dioxygenase family)